MCSRSPRQLLSLLLFLSLKGTTTTALLDSNPERDPQKLSDSSNVCSGQGRSGDVCEVELDVPSSCSGANACPIVFFLHGGNGNNNGYARSSGVHSAGYIGVYPQGENGWNTGPKSTNVCDWDDFDCTRDPDEGAFIAGIISEIRSRGGNGNVYAIGSSNGGALANRLAVNAGDELPIKGIVSIVTQLLDSPPRSGPGHLNYNNPAALGNISGPRVSVLNLMGTADALIRYEGGGSSVFGGDSAFQLMSALDSMEAWAKHNGCSTVPSTTDVTTDTGYGTGIFYEYPCDDNHTIVEHYAINGGGHGSGGSTIDGTKFTYGIAFDFIERLERGDGGGVIIPTPGVPQPAIPEPTSAPSLRGTSVDDSGDEDELACLDDPNWSGKVNNAHTCSFVSQNPTQRCHWENTDGVKAREACKVACGTCTTNPGSTPGGPQPALPEPTLAPSLRGTSADDSGDEDESCLDDPDWIGKFNKAHTCSFVSKNPSRRCKWENKEGIKAREACKVACETCDRTIFWD